VDLLRRFVDSIRETLIDPLYQTGQKIIVSTKMCLRGFAPSGYEPMMRQLRSIFASRHVNQRLPELKDETGIALIPTHLKQCCCTLRQRVVRSQAHRAQERDVRPHHHAEIREGGGPGSGS
jgi:hypothetical protein